nr:WD repeat containing protein 59 [Hymenolepis microstoma]
MNAEMYSPTSIIRWDPFKEYSFATGGELSVQFWDFRASTPSRHLSMQSSRVLAMAWSPGRSGEFAISTKDGSLRIWHVNDFDNALLVSNYKKIPMFGLRYTPKGSGIISVPQRTRWTSSGLILWRSDTLSPMRLVPTMGGDDSYRTPSSSANGSNAEVNTGSSVGNISDDSCVLGFGWCRNEFPPTYPTSEIESEDFNNLREAAKPANLVSWSRDRHLRVHNLPCAFLHVDGVKPPTYRNPQQEVSPVEARKESNSKGSLNENASSASNPADWTSAMQTAQSKSEESEPPAFQFVTQEVSLLSSSIGQYTIESVDRDSTQCAVRLRLYYCRRNHYHHRTICGFDLFNGSSKTASNSRTRSDSLPLADLDALFQSTTDPVAMASATNLIKTGTRTLESLPSAGNMTLLAKFPPSYPAADCPPVFQFIASDPVINEVTLSKILKVEVTRTPRSYHDYRQLVEGKEHLFIKATDSPLGAGRQQQLHAQFYHTPASNFHPPGILKRSRSAEDICIDSSRVHSSTNPSDVSFRGSDSPKEVLRSRHFSGRNPETGARKSSITASGRKIAAALAAEHQKQQHQQHRRSSYVTRFTNLPLSARKSSCDRTFSAGSPLATISDLSALIPISRQLAKNYSLDITDPRHMCSQNLLIALSTRRTDLIQFWSFVTTLSGASLRQAPFPGLVPPYANQSIGQSFFRTWLSHFLHLGDVQSLTMLGFVMAALDAQSSPPALLLTAPFLPATVSDLARQQQFHRVHSLLPSMDSSQRSPFRRNATNVQQAAATVRRTKSTMAPPNLALLDIPEMHPLMAVEDHFQTTLSLKRSALKRKAIESTQSQQLLNSRVERNSQDQPTAELALNVPSASRTRSNSYTIHTSTSSEIDSTTPEVSEYSQRSPMSTISSSGFEHKESTMTLTPDNQNTTSSSTRSHESSTGESAAITQFFQYFKEQVLMDRNGSTMENVKSDSPYTSHVWFLSSKHMLQYTHFLKVYLDLLTAWDLIIPRAKVSSQWYKVLTWMYARSSAEYYHLSLCEPIDRQCQVLLSPCEWRRQHMPIVLTHLLSFSTVHSEVIRPASISSLYADKKTGIRTPLLRCAVCNVAARGVIMTCPHCLHGGHMEHMSAWRIRCGRVGGGEVVCPIPDCECRCTYLNVKSLDPLETEVQGTPLKSVTPTENKNSFTTGYFLIFESLIKTRMPRVFVRSPRPNRLACKTWTERVSLSWRHFMERERILAIAFIAMCLHSLIFDLSYQCVWCFAFLTVLNLLSCRKEFGKTKQKASASTTQRECGFEMKEITESIAIEGAERSEAINGNFRNVEMGGVSNEEIDESEEIGKSEGSLDVSENDKNVEKGENESDDKMNGSKTHERIDEECDDYEGK